MDNKNRRNWTVLLAVVELSDKNVFLMNIQVRLLFLLAQHTPPHL
jgi:hypothetical protein